MKQTNRYLFDMLDYDLPEAAEDILWRIGKPTAVSACDGMVLITVPFAAQKPKTTLPDTERSHVDHTLVVRAYGDAIMRVTLALGDDVPGDDSIMLEWHETLTPEPLAVRTTAGGWEIVDTRNVVRMSISTAPYQARQWSEAKMPPQDSLEAVIFPDGATSVPFLAYDIFTSGIDNSFPLAYVERDGKPNRVAFSLYAQPDEKFAGAGERFTRLNLAGKTFTLENHDALGVNNRRCYKNVPFYVSSRPYGLLMHTPSHVRLSLADVSTQAAQALIEDDTLDLFFIGGGSLERILFNYRRLTGFPKDVPLWSYGMWMSRMNYMSADETSEVAKKMREGEYPCDVLHIDTGWFKTNWVCDWQFGEKNFPEPEQFLRDMRDRGFRITLWQMPTVHKSTPELYEVAEKHRYIGLEGQGEALTGSNLGEQRWGATIDFSNPEAVRWYQGMLERLLKMGVAAIKADFGEEIDMTAAYHALPARKLHNLYALLYQKAVYEITEKTTGEGIIWARSSWVGSQRYPLHWGGDSAGSWDGLAADIRGGLHFGLTGFAFWSHDIPGFYGIPEFMNTWPSEDLYLRWTQVGAFTSHMRYHGAQPREPYEYPGVAPLVRQWLRLRYSLIPYLREEGQKAIASGMPVFRALVLHHTDDPACWQIDDEFYCGDSLLVAPVLNSEGLRNVYLPEGSWTDLWTGEVIQGPCLLRNVQSPLSRIPVYAVTGASVKVYPEVVQCTDEMDLAKSVTLTFDESYRGLGNSVLGQIIEL